MKLQPIINHLAETLPFLTDTFSTVIDVVSITQAAGTATVTTASPHGLTVTNNAIVIVGAKNAINIDIINTIVNPNSVDFKVLSDHNLVQGLNFKDFSKNTIVEIFGAGVFYDGENAVSSVPNKTGFTVNYSSTPPPLTGTPQIFDGRERGFNGLKIVTILSPTTFSYSVDSTLNDPFGTIRMHKDMRVTGTVVNTRIIDMYTPQLPSDLWVFVSESSSVMSKDRNILSDAVTERYQGISFRSHLIDSFACYVASPSTDSISGRFTHDVLEDAKINLIKALAGLGVPNAFTFNENFELNFISDSVFDYDTTKLIKEFIFQGQYDIVLEDTNFNNVFVSAKKIDYNFNNGMTAEINLNEDKS